MAIVVVQDIYRAIQAHEHELHGRTYVSLVSEDFFEVAAKGSRDADESVRRPGSVEKAFRKSGAVCVVCHLHTYPLFCKRWAMLHCGRSVNPTGGIREDGKNVNFVKCLNLAGTKPSASQPYLYFCQVLLVPSSYLSSRLQIRLAVLGRACRLVLLPTRNCSFSHNPPQDRFIILSSLPSIWPAMIELFRVPSLCLLFFHQTDTICPVFRFVAMSTRTFFLLRDARIVQTATSFKWNMHSKLLSEVLCFEANAKP